MGFPVFRGPAGRALIAACAALLLGASSLQAQTLNITSSPFNASTSSSDNASAIRAAISACPSGGTVLVPSGTFLSGPLTLKSNMTFQIASGGTLEMTAMGTFPTKTDFLFASGLSNLTINGSGVMEGQGQAWWTAFNNGGTDNRPPAMIEVTGCSGVTVQGITVQNSPKFHIQFLGNGSNILAQGLSITAPWPSPNTDGIDLRGTNVNIQNCFISDGDDVVQIGGSNATNGVTVSGCTFGTGHGLSIGSITSGGVSNVLVTNCTFNGTQFGLRLKSNNTEGGITSNVTYSNITMSGILKNPILMFSYYPTVPSSPATDTGSSVNSTTPFWKNIKFQNVTASEASTATANVGIVWGLPQAPVSNVLFDACTLKGGAIMDVFNTHGVTFDCNCLVNGQAPTNSSAVTTFNISTAGADDVVFASCGSNPTPTFTTSAPTATRTRTPVPPTSTFTSVPPTATRTNTPVPPTSTFTAIPPTATRTSTPVPPTVTSTDTPVPPTATRTNTHIPPTSTLTAVPPTSTRTSTPVPPTSTFTAIPPTDTPTLTPQNTATSTATSVPPSATNTQVPASSTPTAVPPTATFTLTSLPPTVTATAAPPTATLTAVPPTDTATTVPPTATVTAIPPTVTRTATPVPPTATLTMVPATSTPTAVPPTATSTRTAVPPTATLTPAPPTATHTPVPPTATRTMTAVPPTATSTTVASSGSFEVQLMSAVTANLTNSPHPFLQVVNTGSGPLNLNDVTVRYWFNCDCTTQTVQPWVDWAGLMPAGTGVTGNVQVSVQPTSLGGQTNFILYSFTGNMVLQPGQAVQIQSRFNLSDWSNMTQSNDWSFAANTSYTNAAHVTGYLNGSLTWGQEPSAASTSALTVSSALAFPNPSNGTGTTLSFTLNGNDMVDPNAKVTLKIYTLNGRHLWTTVLTGPSVGTSGQHVVFWNEKDFSGAGLANGVYLIKVTVESQGHSNSTIGKILILG